jgi:hypothetical protein
MRTSMSARLVFAVCTLGVVMAFQNCGKPPSSGLGSGDTSSSPLSSSQYKVTEAQSFSVLSISDENNGRVLDVDLNTGIGSMFRASGSSLNQKRCLTPALKAELVSILAQAQVCEPLEKRRNQQVCTTIYEFPYATLKEANSQVSLGEKTSSCSNSSDLCGDSAAKLRDFASRLVKQLDLLSCQ